MKTPEKIYINDFGSELSYDWHIEHCCENDIEYIQVDALIKAVKKWIAQHDEKDCFTFGYINRNFDKFVEEVKSYMKGE